MPSYPIELDLSGRTVLVVGLGRVGRRKAEGLAGAGARVVGVDPSPLGTNDWPVGIVIRAEEYRVDHLAGVCLAFASATPEVNRRVVADARGAKIWVNSASEPFAGDFRLPAVWRDGDVTLTVSTAGASPALASSLRDRAAAALGPSAAGLAALFAEFRPLVLARLSDSFSRRRILSDWADPRWLSLYDTAGPDAVRAALLRALES